MKLIAISIGLLVLTSCASLPAKTQAMAVQTAVELNNAADHAVNDVKLLGKAAGHIGADYIAVVGAVARIKNAESTP